MRTKNRIEIIDKIDDDGTVVVAVVTHGKPTARKVCAGLNAAWNAARELAEEWGFPVYIDEETK